MQRSAESGHQLLFRREYDVNRTGLPGSGLIEFGTQHFDGTRDAVRAVTQPRSRCCRLLPTALREERFGEA